MAVVGQLERNKEKSRPNEILLHIVHEVLVAQPSLWHLFKDREKKNPENLRQN